MSSETSLLTIGSLQGIGPITLRNIVASNGPPPEDLEGLEEWLSKEAPRGVRSPPHVELVQAWYAAEAQQQRAQRLGVDLIPWWSVDYPQGLKEVRDAPPFLWMRGEARALNQPAVAVVGTRKASEWGKTVARRLGQLFAKQDLVVVSGLALGIDAEAHKGVVSSGGTAVAVLAHGLEDVRPAANRELAKRILEGGGALVSEHSIGTPALPEYFARRNRIQVGLAEAVVVVETGRTGGTMHTVAYADGAGRTLAIAALDLDEGDQLQDDHRSGNRLLLQRPAARALRTPEDVANLAADVRTKHAARRKVSAQTS